MSASCYLPSNANKENHYHEVQISPERSRLSNRHINLPASFANPAKKVK